MRIAVVHSFYSSAVPSGENAVVDAQVAALRAAGHEVRLIARRTDDVGGGVRYALSAAATAATGHGPSPLAELREFAPDVVHVHNMFPNWGAAWLRSAPWPVVTTIHNFRPICAAATLFRDGATCTLCPDGSSINAVVHACYRGSALASVPLALGTARGVRGNAVLSRADRVILLAERSREIYERYGLEGSRVSVVPNFVDADTAVRSGGADLPWVFLGRLTEEKGIVELLESWPDRVPLVVYGGGPDLKRVEELCVGAITYGGVLSHADVPSALAAARGLVFPSVWPEGAPVVYPEALAAGLPVVARSGNSVADDVATGGVGAVYAGAAELAEALDRVARSHASYSAAARARFEQEFSTTRWLERTLRVYGEAVAAYSA